MIHNLEQLRARNAFSFIKQMLEEPNLNDKVKDDIAGKVSNLATMFQKNGVLATFAFLLAKNKDGKLQSLLNSLMNNLKESKRTALATGPAANDIFQGENSWINSDEFNMTDLFIVTDEMIKYATWLKRALEALMPK